MLAIIFIIAHSYGDSHIGFITSLKALFGFGEKADVTIVQNVRLPRVLSGVIAGATLGLSGVFTRIALNNQLADSSILGIQSGASVMALLAILVFPALGAAVPSFAFLGGLFAYFLVIFFSYTDGFSPIRLVLSGVAINSFFTAVTSVITISHINELQGTINWTSGSLVGISNFESMQMLMYASITLIVAFLCIPLLKMLLLEDNMLISLGKNLNKYLFICSIIAVMLASISLAYVGPIAFVGIIAPDVSKLLVGNDIKYKFIMTIIIGAMLIISVDLVGRILFTVEIKD